MISRGRDNDCCAVDYDYCMSNTISISHEKKQAVMIKSSNSQSILDNMAATRICWSGGKVFFLVAAVIMSSSSVVVSATVMSSQTQQQQPQQYHHFERQHRRTDSHRIRRSGGARSRARQLQTLQQCQIALAIGDSNRDDVLAGEVEYPRFVNQLSGQQFSGTTSVADLPQPYQDSYSKYADSSIGGIDVQGSKPGQTPTAAQEEQLNELCTETIAILNGEEVQPGPPTDPPAPTDAPQPTADDASSNIDCTGTIPRAQCNTGLAIADLSRDDLLNEAEYVRLVNRLSNNAYAGSSFDDLPGNIKDNYNKFATTSNQINIFGSKPGQSADSTQDGFLDDFCCETDLAVQNPGAPTEPAVSPPTPIPAPSEGPPTGGGGDLDCTGTVPRSQCNTAMSIADLSRDDLLNEAEYVRFVNRLSSNQYAGSSFGELPSNIQTTFNNFATTGGQVDISGSKPGQTASPDQDLFLDDFCCATDLSILNPSSPDEIQPTPEPTPAAPSSDGTFPPTFADTFCRTAMASSDFNRDDQLNEEEYVRFLNRLTSNEFAGQVFSDLNTELQTNFVTLAGSDNQIDIFGSKPGQTANDRQEEFLGQICLDTAIALSAGGRNPPDLPTSAPGDPTLAPDGQPSDTTSAPTQVGVEPVQPTFPPGLSEVYNSFIIANTLGLTASDLQSGANREGLDNAYTEFATKSVRQIGVVTEVTGSRNLIDESMTNSSTYVPSMLRRRKLVIELVVGSTSIYLLEDSECPDTIQAVNTCQTAFAQFQVSITDEDPQTVSDDYTAASQVQIRNGLLQTTLDEVDPRNALDVVNASFPVRATVQPTPAPVAPTEAPAPAPPSGNGGDGGGSSSTGPIIGGVIGGLVVIAICVYIYFRGVPFGMSAPSFKFGGRGGNKTDDEDDGEGGFDKDDDASAADKDDDDFGEGANTFGSNNKNKFGDDEEKEGQDAKNVFGFRKKEKEEEENRGFGFEDGLESKSSANNSFGDENGGGKYEFDEPSEVREDDDDEKGSVNANEEPFGTTPASPGWGNDFGANNEWGANNAGGNNNGQEQNFFGDSAFGNDEGEGEGSRSGSESDSYTSSEDSTYESEGGDDEGRDNEDEGDYDDEDGSGSFSRSSADDDRSGSYNSGSTPASMASELRRKDEDMDAAIESGDWDAVAKAAGSFGKSQDSSIETSSKKESDGDMSGDVDDEDYTDEDGSGSYSGSSRSGSMSGSGADEGSATSATTTSEDLEKRSEYRAQVDALVKLVLPDETDKVDAMMEQFKGREAELVSTLQTMQERSANQRARAAVHKSKTRPQRSEGADGAYALGANGGASGGEGAAAGTAAIAAASLPIPAAGMFGDEDEFGVEDDGGGEFGDEAFGEDPQYADDEDRSYYSGEDGSRSGSRSYYSGEEDGSGPYSDEGSYSGQGSRSHSGYSGEDSRRESQRSGFSGEDSRRSGFSGEGSRSHYSGEDSRRSGFSGEGSRSNYSGEGSRSHYSGEDSRRSGFSGEGSRSHHSGEDSRRSEFSGSGSRSHYSGEGSRSHYSGEDSRRSGFSGEEGSRSQYSDEGSRSRYSDEEGSGPYSDEGSRSHYSGEEGEGSYDDDEGGSFTGSQEGDGSQSWQD
jgi:hypothetical protein